MEAVPSQDDCTLSAADTMQIVDTLMYVRSAACVFVCTSVWWWWWWWGGGGCVRASRLPARACVRAQFRWRRRGRAPRFGRRGAPRVRVLLVVATQPFIRVSRRTENIVSLEQCARSTRSQRCRAACAPCSRSAGQGAWCPRLSACT
jgi:hypothetical protein